MKKIFIIIISNIYILALNIQSVDKDYKRVNPANSPDVLFSFHSSIKDAKNAVVSIFAEKKSNYGSRHPYNDPYFQYYFDIPNSQIPKSQVERSLGSGVIISSDGYIITNNHVVQNADKIFIHIPKHDKEVVAKVIGTDPKSDLAVLKINKKNLIYLKFSNSEKAKVGDIVFAIGNPFGVGESVTQGIVSALNQSVGINIYENFIQTDASINMGNSGGALVDTRGNLLGINTAILSKTGGSVGIGFAIPSKMVKRIVYDLVKYGSIQRGYLGITIRDVRTDKTYGALVMSVAQNSPADFMGMKKGDLITQINNQKITDSKSLTSLIGLLKPKTKVKVTWLRNNKTISKYTKLMSPKNIINY